MESMLFPDCGEPKPKKRGRPGWTRTASDPCKCAGKYRHDASGYLVKHCGHPTALWPYYIEAPDGRMIVSENGRGFRRLVLAQEHVEMLVQG